jgi:DNA-binding protein HU-beta
LTKAELVKAAAQKAGLKQKDVEKAVDVLIEAVVGAAKNGEEVKLPGFGSFVIVERAARQGKNPRTGEPVSIPARKVVAFRAGKLLKEAVGR